MAKELMHLCAKAMHPYGVDPSGLLKSSQRAEILRGARTLTARKLFEDTFWLSELATEWTENRAYVDTSGHPRVLRIRGKAPSFAALVKKYFGARSVTEIVQLARETHVIEYAGEGKVAQINACVMLTGNPVLLLSRAILCVRWLLSVAERNGLHARSSADSLPERMACRFIPESKIKEYVALMRPQILSVADSANRYLSKHTVRRQPRRRRGRMALVGLHVYVFRD
jgi:hypothetical protein